jgi:hypothetical protein
VGIDDFLSKSEKIEWQSVADVKIGEANYIPYLLTEKQILTHKRKVKMAKGGYILYLTDQRILAYKRTGVILKRDRAQAIMYDEVEMMNYKETGIFWKKGVLEIETPRRTLIFKGKRPDINTLWQKMQSYIKVPAVSAMVGEAKLPT